MRRDDKDPDPMGYKPVFENLSIRWGLIFVDDQIAIPYDLRKILLDILHFAHSRITNVTEEAKIFWWPGLRKEIEQKVKDCTAWLAKSKNLNYQIPKNKYGEMKIP